MNSPKPSSSPILEALQKACPEERVEECLKTLETIIQDPQILSGIDAEKRIRLMKAAGKIAHPTLHDNRKIARHARKIHREKRKLHDRSIKESTGIRVTRKAPLFHEPKQIQGPASRPRLKNPKHCYICKTEYTQLHGFYDALCPACGDFNYQKRYQTVPLDGKTALVTGGRVKIGYYTALKLLRAGARTLVTTRFPHDAAFRFSREEDFAQWKDRLRIYGLDLRHSPSIELFAHYLVSKEERLDILINNAAQTVRKPPGFYRHLMELESTPRQDLPADVQLLLQDYERCKSFLAEKMPASEKIENTLLRTWPGKSPAVGLQASARLAMIPYHFNEEEQTDPALFPAGHYDQDLQQKDLRTHNSWRLTLAEVSTPEMLEVHLVNAVAPFILSSKLKPLMLRKTEKPRYIVNASAMEGKFSRYNKTDKHPHTNMAKAALNMLTLTSASDYAQSGIFMNAVDTGWITDEDPAQLSRAKKEMHDFEPPLDIVDGAARLLDPVWSGECSEEPVWGKFLKDYQPTSW